MEDSIEIRIYYEDTDCGGVVYYANYLKYFERARTEFLEKRGVSLRKLMAEGVYFVVIEAVLNYHSPGRYGDVLVVRAAITDRGPATLLFSHEVRRRDSGDLLVSGRVKLATVSEGMRPVRLPESILKVLDNADAVT